ncbi:hypothetical protein ACA910_019459 [Epithemia clementina (nom. ined.)]
MAPQVKKAKTAFLYFQTDHLSRIRAELGHGASMGDAMTELANQWRALSDEGRAKYQQLEQADRERYERESAEADVQAVALAEERRQALTVQDGEVSSSRGARQKIDEERAAREAARERRRQQRLSDVDDEEQVERRREKERLKKETEERKRKRQQEEQTLAKQHRKLDREEAKKASQRLEYLLKQSSIFAKLQGPVKPATGSKKESPGKSRAHHQSSSKDDAAEGEEEEDFDTEEHVFLTKQPSCIKFGSLKPYQLEALNWMIHLSEKGLNGILADEMGLGKTVQSIAIMAYHYEFRHSQGPHLVCVPKSTLSNWMAELARWCPCLRVLKFHGSREDRETMVETYLSNEAAAHDGRRPDKQIRNEQGELVDDNCDNPRKFDVCVTTYEVANAERRVLQKFAWKYLVIDEAHRLKNDASMFSKTVRSFRTSNRLLLTGTPLQNNLHELWALLNYLLPDIFSSSEQFDEWFDLEVDDEEAKKTMISQLHKILRPFMLRRLKADVAKGLPPKTETILMVGMSAMQKKLYKQLLLRDLDSITGKAAGKNRTAVLNIVMQLRKCCGHPYLFEGVEDRNLDPLGEHLVDNCGKLSMVDKLLKRLKEKGHRCLIFTQMTRVLDILEDFMVMRGYKYCRIDGNTTYDDRESSIENFNRPGSDIFCFILSTRAGGLGINLQTADTCILYDSDWNPQQDLQAQDRCHRLGQKKPVQVFRLVSENTVEEKIVERAQQKLKLDAMVVQQGRLKDKDKVSKEEIMAAVRFGADAVFRSEESTITDEDIDVILARGEAKTKELAKKLHEKDKGDLLDFRLDGGISAQTFEGVDYSDKDLRDHLRMLAANSVGKRERRPPPTSYNPIIAPKKSMVVNNRRIKLPKCLRIPQMEDHQFYNRERLLELDKLEFETYAALREAGGLPSREQMEQNRSLLPPELAQEKAELIAEGFGGWTRTQYFNFVKACAKFGRDDYSSISAELDMPEESIIPYSKAFWKYGPMELKKEWERVLGTIERGEKKILKQKRLSALLTEFIKKFDSPRDEMTFANKGTTHFAQEQDRALLCAVEKHGYGNWDLVREEIRTDSRLKFQHSVQGMSVATIAKRVDYRMRQMERELEAREKTLKNKRPPTVVAAQKTLDAVLEVDNWEKRAQVMVLEGKDPPNPNALSSEARASFLERLKEQEAAIFRLREIEVQTQRALKLAEETRQTIYDGAQYINYSCIGLRPVAGTSAAKDKEVTDEIKEGIDLEASINKEVLKVPICGQCANCTTSNTKLCAMRQAVRNRLLDDAGKAAGGGTKKEEQKEEKKKAPTKKRKLEPSPASPKAPKPKAAPVAKASSTPSSSSSKRKSKLMMVKSDGQLKVRVTSQGNKRMCIPDELFPEFCRRITAFGTSERQSLINRFIEENPTISNRQITMKLSEITVKNRPKCVPTPEHKTSRFMIFLRPAFYKYLRPEDRPDGWEPYAAADEILYKEEQEKKEASSPTGTDNGSPMARISSSDATAVSNDGIDGESNDGVEGEETEDEDGPAPKKVRSG